MRKGIDCKGKEWEEINLYGKMVNIARQNFGNLIALFPVRCNGKSQWLCKCNCGNELVVAYTLLNGGNTKSCGCYHRELMLNRWSQYRDDNNVIGMKYGKLTVVNFVCIDNGRAIYHFKCDCGNEIDFPLIRVKTGGTSSCGCLWTTWNDITKSDIIGQRFGKLVVESYAGINNLGGTQFKCLCDCGNSVIVSRNALVRGHTHSCGCMRSIGENNIKQILEDANICYKPQYAFDDLISEFGGYPLYDFAILNNNGSVERLIEFDGEQHNKPYNFFGGEEKFLKVKSNDDLKNQYALSHNIPLIRIPYSKRDSITLDDLFGNKYLIKEEN